MRTMLILLFTLAALSFAQAEDQIRITGVVSDMDTEAPISGVKVYPREWTLEPEKWVSADEKGNFTLVVDRNDARLPGESVLYARTADGSRIGAMDYVSWGNDFGMDCLWIPLQPASSVTGTVVDADGNPVAGALVESGGFESYFTKTDENGEFKILLPDRGGILFASHEDFGSDFVGISMQREPVKLTLQPAKPVKIRVVTEAGIPLPGVEVCPARTELTEEDAKRHGIDFSLKDPEMDAEDDVEYDEDNYLQFPWSWHGVSDTDGMAKLGLIPESMLENMRFYAHTPRHRVDGIPMPDGTRYFTDYSNRGWDEMNSSDGVPTYTVPRVGCLILTVTLPDGTPASGMRFLFDNVSDPFGASTDEDGKKRVFGKLGRMNMYEREDWGKVNPLLADIDLSDGTRAVEIDYVYDGILLHGTVYFPDGTVSESPMPMRMFQCGARTFYDKNGEYRCVIPRAAGKYTISLDEDCMWNPEDEEFSETIDVKGDETEIHFDIHINRKEEL